MDLMLLLKLSGLLLTAISTLYGLCQTEKIFKKKVVPSSISGGQPTVHRYLTRSGKTTFFFVVFGLLLATITQVIESKQASDATNARIQEATNQTSELVAARSRLEQVDLEFIATISATNGLASALASEIERGQVQLLDEKGTVYASNLLNERDTKKMESDSTTFLRTTLEPQVILTIGKREKGKLQSNLLLRFPKVDFLAMRYSKIKREFLVGWKASFPKSAWVMDYRITSITDLPESEISLSMLPSMDQIQHQRETVRFPSFELKKAALILNQNTVALLEQIERKQSTNEVSIAFKGKIRTIESVLHSQRLQELQKDE